MLFTRKTSFNKVLATIGALTVGTALAAVTPEERASIGLEGTKLTPSGAIRAGNAEGTIPEWKNVPTPIPEGFKPGMFHLDPFADDAVRFTITPQNFQEHADKLSEGQKKMFETYPDYFMNIYPTRRSMVYKPYIYEAALKNLDRAVYVETDSHMGMIGFTGARRAWAFPIPHNANEAWLNQQSRPKLPWNESKETTTAVASTGDYVVNKLSVEFHYNWSDPEVPEDDPRGIPTDNILLYSQTLTAPAKVAGQVVLALEPITFTHNFRKAWAYSPGQRRVKRAPQIVYDNPITAGDGLGTTDQAYGFNGPNDRFTYKLLGKREVYVPYNPYKLFAKDATPDKVIMDNGRLNQHYARYELHRVWVIETNLKEGTNHDYARRTYYLDEDSWEVMLSDNYDRRMELWRHWEDHNIWYYDVQFPNRVTEVQYDFNAHRMLTLMFDKNKGPNFAWREPDNYFTPAAVRRRGVR
ncbi:MAG: DUF1329 domain-containing protein [Gammaproteobacteria bacterium]|nr:MAG: DUF1329 domain-containing protein [Gammaproteobacteria bacterium]